MEEFKTLKELKEEFGKNYDIKLYEMGISAMKEIAQLNEIINKAIKYIKKNIPYWEEWHYDGVIDTDDMNIIIDILKGDKNV